MALKIQQLITDVLLVITMLLAMFLCAVGSFYSVTYY